MRPEIDYTRQRTVAELLAEHGEAGPGRRRRREGDGPVRPVAPPPPHGAGGPPPAPPSRYPHDAAPPRPARDPGPQTVAGYRGAAPVAPRPAPVRRDRPTEMIPDRQPRPGTAGYGPGAVRGAPPSNQPSSNQTGRSTASGPMRVVPPGAPSGPGRANASGPLRAVPPTTGPGVSDGAPPANGRAGTSGPLRAVSPSPAAGPWEPKRDGAGGSGRLRPVTAWAGSPAAAPPGREQPGASALREPVGRPYLPTANPPPAQGRPSAAPSRGPAPQAGGPPQRAVPDSGPATGAWDPFEFDDEDDDGPHTVVGARDTQRRVPRAAPRRDAFAARSDGPVTDLDLGTRRGDGPARPGPTGRARPTDGPATDFDVTALRQDAGATDLDVTGRAGPVTEFDLTGTPRSAPARPTFGSRERSGRAAAPLAPRPPAAPPMRVRPFARTVLDEPTELTDRGSDDLLDLHEFDDRTDVAAPRRAPLGPPTRGVPPDDEDDDPQEFDDYADDDLHGDRFDPDDLDERDRDPGHDRGHDDVEDPDDREHDSFLDLDLEHDDLERDAGRPAQAWAGVVAQWLAGAVAGAVLWVLFRYLWRELPVVALAAAVLVTAGLVLLVRQLLHHVDRRTTGFAVVVGLLLTASPAVLVLLGR